MLRLLACAALLPLGVELARHFVGRRWGERLSWLPRATLWILLALTVASQLFWVVGQGEEKFWAAAILAAILLSFELRQDPLWVAADLAGWGLWAALVVPAVYPALESPFTYAFPLALQQLPGRLAGKKDGPGETLAFGGLLVLFPLLLLLAELASGPASQRLAGFALVAFVLLLRQLEIQAIVFVPLTAALFGLANLAGAGATTFNDHPILLLGLMLAGALGFFLADLFSSWLD